MRTRAQITADGWARSRAGEGFIYVARTESGMVKIGYSLVPDKRTAELRCTLIATMQATRQDEVDLHARLKSFEIAGYGGRSRAREYYVPAVLDHGAIPERLRADAKANWLRIPDRKFRPYRHHDRSTAYLQVAA